VSGSSPGPAAPSRWAWSAVIALLSLAAFAGLDAAGKSARRPFNPVAQFGAARWGAVRDAADAVQVWRSSGVRGQRLLVLTGRWGKLQKEAARLASSGRDLDQAGLLDASSALFAAMHYGLARDIQVVMPLPAFNRRRAALRATSEHLDGKGDGWFLHLIHGFARRFSTPDQIAPPGEPVLLLVEPSYFSSGSPGRPDLWLQERGIPYTSALVALSDPESSAGEQEQAALFAGAVGAVRVELSP
jgi:hypothetical protein